MTAFFFVGVMSTVLLAKFYLLEISCFSIRLSVFEGFLFLFIFHLSFN